MAAQTAHDLRTVVARRVGLKRRVVLLARDVALVQALEANGCVVLADPPSLDEVQAFGPEVVVAFDGFAQNEGAAFSGLASAAPNATLLFSFANASSATHVLGALGGKTPPSTIAEPDVRTWLARAGYSISSKERVVSAHTPSGLAPETEASLRQLFEQLNPDAGVDRFVVQAERVVVAAPPELTPGLVSVIVAEAGNVDGAYGTLGALAALTHKPVEVVFVNQSGLESVDRMLKPIKGRAGFTGFGVNASTANVHAQLNAGLAAARGQFVCFLEAADLPDGAHVSRLHARLSASTAAWAVAPLTRGLGPFEVGAWARSGAVDRNTYLINRSALGAFSLSFAEGVDSADLVLFVRLASLFRPEVVAGAALAPARRAQVDIAALTPMFRARPLQTLVSLESLLAEPKVPSWSELTKDRLEAADPKLRRVFERFERAVDAAKRAKP